MLCKCLGVITLLVALLLGGFLSGEFARIGVIRKIVEDLVDVPRLKGAWPSTIDLASNKHWTYDKLGNLNGKVALVTGGNTGLGFHTALEIARKGATVVVGCRNDEKCSKACEKINNEIKGSTGIAIPMKVDLGAFESVASFSRAFRNRFSRLDIFVQNAGIPSGPEFKLTADGIERTMHSNHFGHAQMTKCLEELIQTTAAESEVRIVAVASGAHYAAPPGVIEWMDSLEGINSEENFNRTNSYSISKLANILHAKGMAKHLGSNVIATACHPGMVGTSIWESEVAQEILKSLNLHPWVEENIILPWFKTLREQVMWTSSQGAWTQTYLATTASKSLSGQYFHPVVRSMSPNQLAQDADFVQRFWDFTQRVVEKKC